MSYHVLVRGAKVPAASLEVRRVRAEMAALGYSPGEVEEEVERIRRVLSEPTTQQENGK